MILLLSKTIWYQNTSETQNGSPTMIFGDVRQNNSTKLWYPYYLKIFGTRTFLKHRRARPRCFRRLGTKKLQRKNVTSPLLSINFLRTRNFLKNKSVPPRSFSVLWDKKFSTENREPLLICINFLGALNFFKSLEGSPQVFSTVRQKQSTEEEHH